MSGNGNGNGARGRLRILTYHRVAEIERFPRLNPRLISATPAVFDQQMRLVAHRYRPVSLAHVVEAATGGATLPPRAVLVTFDDGYHDFRDHAWPILKKHEVPATVFVPTAYPDRPERSFWWDRLFRGFVYTDRTRMPETLGGLDIHTEEERWRSLRAVQVRVKEMPHEEAMTLVDEMCEYLGEDAGPVPSVMGWDDLRRLAAEGLSLAPHTRWHPLLTRVDRARVREEVVGSRDDLALEIGQVLPVFSYPNGAHDEVTVQVMRDEGFAIALTQSNGHNDLRKVDPRRLRRLNVTRRNTARVIDLRLRSWFAVIDRWRKPEQ